MTDNELKAIKDELATITAPPWHPAPYAESDSRSLKIVATYDPCTCSCHRERWLCEECCPGPDEKAAQ